MFVTLSRKVADFRLKKNSVNVSRILFLGESCLLLGFVYSMEQGYEGPETSL